MSIQEHNQKRKGSSSSQSSLENIDKSLRRKVFNFMVKSGWIPSWVKSVLTAFWGITGKTLTLKLIVIFIQKRNTFSELYLRIELQYYIELDFSLFWCFVSESIVKSRYQRNRSEKE